MEVNILGEKQRWDPPNMHTFNEMIDLSLSLSLSYCVHLLLCTVGVRGPDVGGGLGGVQHEDAPRHKQDAFLLGLDRDQCMRVLHMEFDPHEHATRRNGPLRQS